MEEKLKDEKLNKEDEVKNSAYNYNSSLVYLKKYVKCVKCGAVYPNKIEVCDECKGRLFVNTTNKNKKNPTPNYFIYIACVLVPLLGIILGCINISKGKKDFGKSLIIVNILSAIACILALIL